MKTVLLFILLVVSATAFAQTSGPGIQWKQNYSNSTHANCIVQTPDNGYIMAGQFISDFWVTKIDNAGVVQWEKKLGGSGTDVANAVQVTKDGGYIVVGSSLSNDGDVTRHHGTTSFTDFWVVKLTATGDIEWQKSLGGKDNDVANAVSVTADGEYIVAGYSFSWDGDIANKHTPDGSCDYWVVKLTATGAIKWQKCLGGAFGDYATCVQVTKDGGFIVGGGSGSKDGDVTGHHGATGYPDYWIVKLDSLANIQWQKSLGGSNPDEPRSIQTTADSGYIVAGYTQSNNWDVSGNHANNKDYWVVKLTANGTIQWQKCLGGTLDDFATCIQVAKEGGYIVGGYSISVDGDRTYHYGTTYKADYWVVKLTESGAIDWQKTLGGSDGDGLNSIETTTDGGYILAGETVSKDGDVTNNTGYVSAWVVKLNKYSRINIAASYAPGSYITMPQGTPVSFTAAIAAEVTSPSYQWKKNNINVGTNNTVYNDSLIKDGDSVYCVITANGRLDTSNVITFKTYVRITISANTNTVICDSTPVTFNATISGVIQSPVYHWKKNNHSVGANSSVYKDSLLRNGDSVFCVVTSPGRSDTSNAIRFTIYKPAVSIIGSSIVCAGETIIYKATVSNPTPSYHFQWKRNNINVGSDSLYYKADSLNNGDSVWCVVNSNTGCTASAVVISNKIKATINPYVLPTINIASSPATYRFCSTAPAMALTFHASIKNGGGAPVYQWKKNNINVGTNSAYYADSLHNGDSVWCVFTSSAKCITNNYIVSNKLKITITAPVTPTVTVAPLPAGPICLHTPVRFKASIKNGGSAPHYQWKKNNVTVGTDSDTYNDSLLFNNDSVWCVFTSNAECAVGNPATSAKIKATVANAAPLKPSAINGPANVTANQQAIGYAVNLVNNVSYVWAVPAGCTIVNGQGTNQIVVNWGTSTGSIIVRAKNACGQSDSSKLLVHVVSSFGSGAIEGTEDGLKTAGKEGIQLYPNPAVNTAYISFTSLQAGKYFIQVTDAQGRVLQTKETNAVKGDNKVMLSLAGYAQGMYFIKLAGSNKQQSLRLLIQR